MSAETLCEAGNAQYKRGQFEAAIDLYTQAVDAHAADEADAVRSAAPPPSADDRGSGDTRSDARVRALANRAQCWLQLRDPARAAADCDAVRARAGRDRRPPHGRLV